MASIRELHATASRKADGFQGMKYPTHAVYVAVGKAAERRGHPGKVVVSAEWYRPEKFDDDDASVGGYLIPTKSGHARVSREVAADSVGEAARKLKAAIPKIIADAIDE